LELTGVGHMEFLDPASDAHLALCRCLEEVFRPSAPP
jgi:hypothetical protein